MNAARSLSPHRAKLIFNPIAGLPTESPGQLLTIIEQLQEHRFIPEVFIVQPGCDIARVVQDAYDSGIRHFVVSGGDGTVESVAAELSGTRATLAVIPTGTQNNVALSLNVPRDDLPAAVALLRKGKKMRVDMGIAGCCNTERPFLEFCTVGLISALFPAADDVQKGNLLRIGDFLSTLVNAPVSRLNLLLDGRKRIETQGHIVLVANMPYLGPNYPLSAADSFLDGWLDVLVFADLTKLQLLTSAVTMAAWGDDPRIQRYRVRKMVLESDPPMPVMADGVSLGEGRLEVQLRRRALNIMAGPPPAVVASEVAAA
jgi:diacylglycerol kinase family enzyme